MATTNEIESLKKSWRYDPCWDIENTEGFEEHKEELLAYRLGIEKEWQEREDKRINERADKLKCSVELVRYLENLERRIDLK